MTQAERIEPLLKEAVTARIRIAHLVAEIEEILAGEGKPEALRCYVENTVAIWIDDFGMDFDTADGFGAEDVKNLLDEIEYGARDLAVMEP